MREVDHALAKVFAKGTPSPSADSEAKSRRGPRSVPPAPHFTNFEPPESGSTLFEPASSQMQWPELVLQLEHEFQDQYTKLADSLIASRNPRSLLVTSRQRAEGRTTLILALARAFSRRPGRTLILDADLSNPTIARRFDVRPEIGWDDVVTGANSLGEASLESTLDGVSLLMLRGPVAAPRPLLRNSRWTTLLQQLRESFDRILIDSGPVYATSSILTPRQPIDAVLIVRNRELTDLRRLPRVRAFIEGKGYPVVGLAETFAPSESSRSRGVEGDV